MKKGECILINLSMPSRGLDKIKYAPIYKVHFISCMYLPVWYGVNLTPTLVAT